MSIVDVSVLVVCSGANLPYSTLNGTARHDAVIACQFID
jgi:hypothetical protein